jgi:broad specificity phosphatase PhoE
MRRLVLLCRHGNTFSRGEKVVMVGAREDLSLTEFGREQGVLMGAAIRSAKVYIDDVCTGPLKRTREYAEIIRATAQISALVTVDQRLIELDYGAWGGLSDDEIVKLSGEEALRRWHHESIRPSDVPFIPSEEVLRAECLSFLRDISQSHGVSLVVTSNGRLREFGKIIAPVEGASYKVRTGCGSLIEWADDRWKILAWDCEPEELGRLL